MTGHTAQFVADLDPVLVSRTGAILVCLFVVAAIIALLARGDRRRLRLDPHAEPFGDGHGFTAEQLAEFRGHMTPTSVDPLRRSLFYPVSAGVALRTDAGAGDPSIPPGCAGARTRSARLS